MLIQLPVITITFYCFLKYKQHKNITYLKYWLLILGVALFFINLILLKIKIISYYYIMYYYIHMQSECVFMKNRKLFKCLAKNEEFPLKKEQYRKQKVCASYILQSGKEAQCLYTEMLQEGLRRHHAQLR